MESDFFPRLRAWYHQLWANYDGYAVLMAETYRPDADYFKIKR